MKLCAGGDLVIQTELPEENRGADELHKYISAADVRICNLEVPIVRNLCWCSTFSGGTPMAVKPYVIDVMRRYGFQACGCCNNHTFDYGIGGLQQTMKYLDEAHFYRAGIGNSLDEASAPVSIPTPKGRVAYIALYATSSVNDSTRAGYAHEDLPPRPGQNGLRRTEELLVTKEDMAFLRSLAQGTMVNAAEEIEAAYGYGSPQTDTFAFGSVKFRESDHRGRITRVNETDMQRTERGIRSAKLGHEYCVVSLHSHQFKGRVEHEPDYYMEDFAHRCIDAGADAVIGTGTHIVKGIEIYKGKPIFYCLGNFIFQSRYVPRVPADFLEKKGYPSDMLAQEAFHRLHSEATHSMEDFPIYEMAIVPRWEMDGDKLTKIELLPIRVGGDQPKGLKGFPEPMAPSELEEHLRMVCEPYGTKIRTRGDVFEVVLDA